MTDSIEIPIGGRAAGCPFAPVPELYEAQKDEELRRVTVPSPMLGAFDAVVVTRYEDVKNVLADDRLRMGGSMPYQAGNLLSYDGPEHTRLRRMLTASFTARRAREQRPQIEEVVTAALDEVEKAGPGADLVQLFCTPIPTLVICELLGVPYADREEFQRRTAIALDFSNSREVQMEKAAEMEAYMAGLVAGHREEPGDNVLGRVVREYGDQLTDSELAGIGNMLLIAGHETIANTLASSIALLLQHPDQLAVVRDEPEAVDGAVEELLRYVVPATILPRQASGDIPVRDQEIKEGERVVASVLAANRDLGASGEDLDRLDVRRPVQRHLTFGFGPHQCLGQQLARMELRVALPALFNRFPELRLAVAPEELDYRTNALVFGVNALPVTW
ncbi:cytochrome P450 [Streptomyces griseoviridis]|jgi:cytochrome P450|uniref:Cytochrome P450 n=3 Tax=Streptomyces TaxID=1883 RepID=A0A918GTU9_STRGD|nr:MULTISPECIES: cytochrome P450 [Streptomyces]MDP9686197.1 cytochrome P450 [Streptomyces griseoviridis]GGS62470.1 cytochrome P450 [Streptomyces niveoruber]GGT15246.1 cytochrome P450 [Streptomyces griseoviridis]GGU57083.1 cytochrome P450 [Streptomyces daghestanicus]GHI35485.1 cytochrome P450 [Streptomyces daghestanicus]